MVISDEPEISPPNTNLRSMAASSGAFDRALDIGVYGARGIPSTYSGYETFLTVLLPELAARNHRVTMYCRNGHGPGSGEYRGVRVVELPAIETKQLSTLSHGLLASIAARLERHDVVLVVNVANALFCILARSTGQRVVLNTDGQEWLRGKWGSVGRQVFRASARLAGLSSSGLIADSVAMREVYRSEFNVDSTVIPYCWTDISDFEDAGSVDEELGVERHRYFVIAGRMVPENHADDVAAAYAAVDTDWPLLILGEANYDSPVTKRITALAAENERIRAIGHVADRGRFSALLRDAGAYIHAHSVGGINPSLIEAMGSAALTVALDTPFNREALGDTGVYFNDFAGSLSGILSQAPEYEQRYGHLRTEARKRALTHFNRGGITDAYEQLLLSVRSRPAWATSVLATVWSEPV